MGTARKQTYVAMCVGRMNTIAAAIQQYRTDHKGTVPTKLGHLVPKYLSEEDLVCPYTAAIALDFVKVRQQRFKQKNWTWSSYFYFSLKGLDWLRDNRGEAQGFSDVLKERGADTPLAVCRDHREPFSLNPFLGTGQLPPQIGLSPGDFPSWFFPDAPVVVLRWDGRVTTTKKGGARTNNTWGGTDHDLLGL